MIWLLPHPLPPTFPVSKLDLRHTGRLKKRNNLWTVEGGMSGGGAKSYDDEKALSSLNHSILSDLLQLDIESDSLVVFIILNCI